MTGREVMTGIQAYAVYLPLYRLGPETAGWSGQEKTIAAYDEDSLTMAVAAGRRALAGIDRNSIDAVFFASTSFPYLEKQAATIAAAALDLKTDIATADFGNTLRAGTSALLAALDSVAAGTARSILVLASDRRTPQSGSELEATVGDGAVALVVGGEPLIAQYRFRHCVSREIVDVWRSEADSHPRTWEDRFVIEEGYLPAMSEAVQGLLSGHAMTSKDVTRAALYVPEARRLGEIARRLGMDVKGQVEQLPTGIGNTGAAMALMLLTASLDKSSPGDNVLVSSYGQGADAILFTVARPSPSGNGPALMLASRRVIADYNKYLKWRGLLNAAPGARRPPLLAPSAPALFREQEQVLRLHGARCRSCGTVQYPPQRICTRCRAADNFDAVSLADKKAVLATYSYDFLTASPDPPTVTAVIDFEAGGRMVCNMADKEVDSLRIGMPLEMTFRWLHTVEGIHNYYWKCAPLRA